MNKSGIKKVKTDEARLRKNIRQKVNRAIKRGYYFTLPDIKKMTAKELEKLNKEIYEYADYITKSGEVASGSFGRTLEMREAARKGHETRMKKGGKTKNNRVYVDEAELKIRNFRERVNNFHAPEYKKVRRKNKKNGKVYIYEIRNNADVQTTISVINSVLDKAIEVNGDKKVAEILDANSAEIDNILNYLEHYGINNDYEIGSFEHPRISQLIRILIGRPLSSSEIDEVYYAEMSMEQ